MATLEIASVPTDRHSETNFVYTNPADAVPPDSIIEIGGFYFTVKHDDAVKPGSIGLNLMQRKCAKVSTTAGDRATIPPRGFKPKSANIAQINIEVEYIAASKKGGSLDYINLHDLFMRNFTGQWFKVGQQILLAIEGVKYFATVTNLQVVGEKGAAAEAGVLIAESKWVMKCAERCGIQVLNEPESDAKTDLVMDFNLEKLGIGGLRSEFGQVFRRAFASRIFPPSIVKKLGIRHVKGMLLFGPPGTGKTLIARKIGEILRCKEPIIVNGPEIFSKYVGQAEENIRKLFADAEAEQAAKGDKSQLHLIIFDEFDAICKQRGAVRDSTGVSDNVVNQLLSKIDGVKPMNNVLLIGMTNRKDLIDEAILRPGRFEVHVEIGLPDEAGRVEILRIHTRGMVENKVLHDDVDYGVIAAQTKNFSGAELEGLVRSAQSHAFSRHIDFDNPTDVKDAEHIKIQMHDFLQALKEVKPNLGRSEETISTAIQAGIIDYGRDWTVIDHRTKEFVRTLAASPKMQTLSILLTGPAGCGKSAIAANLALGSDFPYVKVLSPNSMVAYGEMQKANIFRKAFDDAQKSKLSVIVLDDIERLVEYSALGGKYSNTLLQTLLVLIKVPPPEGKKMLVIGTSNTRDVMRDLEITDVFSAELEVPNVPPTSLPQVVKGLGVEWESPADAEKCVAALQPMPMKKLIFLIEMAAVTRANDERRFINDVRFVDAVLNTGVIH